MANQSHITEIEEWRDIPGWEGFYQVSSIGRLRSVDRIIERVDGQKIRRRGNIKSQHRRDNGYKGTTLYRPGLPNGTNCLIHRAVCKAFHPRPPGIRTEVAHADGDKDNNHFSNLRWATSLENAADKYLHGTVGGILTEGDVRQIRRLIALEIRELAQKYGVSEHTVAAVVYGKSWKPIK